MPTIAGKSVGSTGYGLMSFGIGQTPTEDAIKTMKRSLELGANLWNGGEFYGPPTANSLHLLNAYFKAHPEDVEKVVINIKGALDFAKMSPDGTDAGIRKSVDNCIQILGGTKKIDVFEMARVDPNVPIEESVGYLAKLIEEGKISAIALSEVRADTIRRAAKVHKIAGGVEIEFSLFATEPLTNGIFEACAENDIPVIAYSPLGRGLLTGKFDSSNPRHGHNPRAKGDSLDHNMQRANKIIALAEEKGCTPGQLSIAWVKSFNGRPGMPTVIPIPGTSSQSRLEENMKDVELTAEDLKKIDEILASTTIIGDRYPESTNKFSEG